MDWYNTLTREQKVNIREVFELVCGLSLNNALLLFKFRECMDILYEKLKMEDIV